MIGHHDRIAWKEEHRLVQKTSESLEEIYKACFLTVGVVNKGRGIAQDCVTTVSFYKQEGLWTRLRNFFVEQMPERAYLLNWGDPPQEIEVRGFPGPVVSSLRDKTNISPKSGVVLSILFIAEKSNKAFLLTDREVPLSVPSTTDLILSIVGFNFAAKKFGRYRLVLNSWNDIDLFKVTSLTKMSRWVRKRMQISCELTSSLRVPSEDGDRAHTPQ